VKYYELSDAQWEAYLNHCDATGQCREIGCETIDGNGYAYCEYHMSNI
jgi:hypothetical protein